ncbi:M4 family metallopeptidase [Mycobacterium sp. 852014-50255_SCH5639931]|uniref:M4 family metallopeptidase n=1 Tax=Mycobacterium sp. 852014-50255_SCH5639931 TaxID=1834112 RepID=UPI000800F24C|nr:M4 family metallopeptidase [Mycobacterium sp. 852014-50255_SCH5639931]OBB65841.1 peptidase [Mycobacterium sp. 852014-50255_SCH5639931]
MGARRGCCIVPTDVLRKLAEDESMPAESRQAFRKSVALEPAWRTLRIAHTEALQASLLARGITSPRLAGVLAPAPEVTVYDCKRTPSLPGTRIPKPGSSTDITAKRAFDETTAVARFYQQCFGRNSIDDAGMTLMSSIHYDERYANAFWNGAQMVYGDGDGEIFIDFTTSNDVIAHELTHGVTEHTAGLIYEQEPGALNESISDVFGSMFRQWRKKQTVAQADWLIGADILGPAAIAKGYTCLRDMAQPGAKHCLSPQPSHYRDYIRGGDVHENSGIPNHAFYLAAMAIGGRSWEKAGKVWYGALTSAKARPGTKFKAFADLTRSAAKSLFPTESAVYRGVDDGWTQVGIS